MYSNRILNKRFETLDKEYNRTYFLVRVVFVFIICLWLTILSAFGYLAYTVISDPGVVGRTAGNIVTEFNKQVAK